MRIRKMGYETWGEIYKVDANEAYVNGGFTEEGEQVYCVCGGEMEFAEDLSGWKCNQCGLLMSRIQWFDEIDAHRIPGKKCLTHCKENYPICKNWCLLYKIPDSDPIL